MGNYYKPGCWNVICAVCGVQFKSDQVRKRWDGVIVCANDYEERHPLDFLRVLPERTTVPYIAPEPDDLFVDLPIFLTAAVADYGRADMAVVGILIPEGLLK